MSTKSMALRVAFAALTCTSLAAAGAPSGDPWPRVSTNGGNRIVVFQPQVESWQSNRLSGRAVVEVNLQYDVQPRVGVTWFTATTMVDNANRLVTLDKFQVTKVQFSAVAQTEANMQDVVRSALPQGARTIALDRLVTASLAAQHQAKAAGAVIKNEPPKIIWTTNAVATLVLIDGNPELRPVQNSSLMRVINTASLMLLDPNSATYYLRGNGRWFQATQIAGPWTVNANPPSAVAALTPPPDGSQSSSTNSATPAVYVSTQPAELLHTVGPPQLKSENGSGMMYIANTDSQVFYDLYGTTAYILISGRWFSAQSLNGPWAYVQPKNLPNTFSQISSGGPKGVVLSSVPGTPEATAARVATSLPQTATIQRGNCNFQVQYDGAPQLKPIEGTTLQYVVNASDPVILCQSRYFAVGNAVWFSATTLNGPWAVAAAVPPEIYTIPSTSPLYYVTFVYIAYADDNQVEEAYTPGYTGSYVDSSNDCGPVYGTGAYYTPWLGNYYYGWGWPYGYGYQYRWWENGWLWRPPWSGVGNFYARNARNLYDAWPAAVGATAAREARVATDRALGYGYPTTYGRVAGALRAAPMPVPARAMLVNPYAYAPRAAYRAGEVMGGAELVNSVRVGSAAARDLYATPDGGVYMRKAGNWYRAGTDGRWGYVAPAVGPVTHPYHPQTVANYDNRAIAATARVSTEAANVAADRANTARALDQDYQARATAEASVQQYHPEYRRR